MRMIEYMFIIIKLFLKMKINAMPLCSPSKCSHLLNKQFFTASSPLSTRRGNSSATSTHVYIPMQAKCTWLLLLLFTRLILPARVFNSSGRWGRCRQPSLLKPDGAVATRSGNLYVRFVERTSFLLIAYLYFYSHRRRRNNLWTLRDKRVN